jgi:hypothetical protein
MTDIEIDIAQLLSSMTVEDRDEVRRLLRQMDKCEHLCAHGPGHQSLTKCEAHGIHDYHHVDVGSGSFDWADGDESEVVRKPWKRDEQRKLIFDENHQLIPDEPYTESVFFAPYWE